MLENVRRSILKLLAGVSAAFLLVSCTTTSPTASLRAFDADSKSAVVIIGLHRDPPRFEELQGLFVRGFDPVSLNFIGRYARAIGHDRSVYGQATVNLDGEDRTKASNLIYSAFALHPGHYFIERQTDLLAEEFYDAFKKADNSYTPPKSEMHRFSNASPSFEVRPGKLYYLGEFEFSESENTGVEQYFKHMTLSHNGLKFVEFNEDNLTSFMAKFPGISVSAEKMDSKLVGFTCTGDLNKHPFPSCKKGYISASDNHK